MLLEKNNGEIVPYSTTKEIMAKWGISIRRINRLCQDGRVPDAQKIGGMWLIPSDTPKPADSRLKKG